MIEKDTVCTKRFDTNEAEDAESNTARASIDEPSGASTRIPHVINNKLELRPTAALDAIDLTDESDNKFELRPTTALDAIDLTDESDNKLELRPTTALDAIDLTDESDNKLELRPTTALDAIDLTDKSVECGLEDFSLLFTWSKV